jgi:hypothetical protein
MADPNCQPQSEASLEKWKKEQIKIQADDKKFFAKKPISKHVLIDYKPSN